MRKKVLRFIAACFYYSGLVGLARWRTKVSGKRLVILNYHHASGGNLRSHLLYLSRHYRILHLEAALEELFMQHKNGHNRPSRRIPLVLTFDDGYRDNYTYGFALARELEIPFTLFLIPGYVGSGDRFWWLEVKRLVSRAQVNEVTIEGHTYDLHQIKERILLAYLVDRRVRYAASLAEREAFLVLVRKSLAVQSSTLVEEESHLPLKWEEVQEMAESGWVSFGAHTMHHPILSSLTNPTEIEREVGECRQVLEEHLGHSVRTFAYPVGQLQHIGEHVRQSVREAGYTWALTTKYGFNSMQSDPLLLRRIDVDVSQHWLVIAAATAGLWGIFARLRWIPFIRNRFTDSTPHRSNV